MNFKLLITTTLLFFNFTNSFATTEKLFRCNNFFKGTSFEKSRGDVNFTVSMIKSKVKYRKTLGKYEILSNSVFSPAIIGINDPGASTPSFSLQLYDFQPTYNKEVLILKRDGEGMNACLSK